MRFVAPQLCPALLLASRKPVRLDENAAPVRLAEEKGMVLK